MKIVLITPRVEVNDEYYERRDCLDQKWSNFLIKCGLVPLICPNNIYVTKHLLKEIKISGIILSGGGDLVKYGGKAPERDIQESFLLDYSITHNIPLLGVCRGMQMIMDYFGVELHEIENHVNVSHLLSHADTNIIVNSFHKLGITDLKNVKIHVNCRSEDGVIEKIKHLEYPIHGIMWHPERNDTFTTYDISFFQEVFC